MVDKSSLRSNRPDSSASNTGEKALPSKSSSTSNSQGKPAPTRTTSNRSKTTGFKRAAPTNSDQGGGDETPTTNGIDSAEAVLNGTAGEVEMKDDRSDPVDKARAEKDKTGDEEMTVVVPPAKGPKLTADPVEDDEGDTQMQESSKVEAVEPPEKADPVEKAVSGTFGLTMTKLLHDFGQRVSLADSVPDIKSNFPLLERAVAHFDPRFSLRALRSISSIRKQLTADILIRVICEAFPSSNPIVDQLLAAIRDNVKQPQDDQLSSEMEVDSGARSESASANRPAASKDIFPEVEVYLSILVQVLLFDSKAFEAGAALSTILVKRIHSLNRRTLDSLSARVYFYFSLFHEQLAPLPPSPLSPLISIRQQLLAALRTSVLRKDSDTQATVTTLLLRNYLATSHISQADLLVSHTSTLR